MSSKIYAIIAGIALGILSFNGCGDSSDAQGSTVSGQVIGSYYEGATVCIDLNLNDVCDTHEPTSITDSNGSFTLPTILQGYQIIAHIPVGSIKHSDTMLSNVDRTLTFYTMSDGVDSNGKLMVNAVTTAIVARMKSYDIDFNKAKSITAMKLNIGKSFLLENFNDSPRLSTTQKQLIQNTSRTYLEHIESVLAENKTLHFKKFLALQGETENPWKEAAIDWTVDSGLDFLSDGVFSLLGLGDKDASSEELNEIASDLDSINDQLQEVNAQLQTLNNSVYEILNSILTTAVNTDKKQFSDISDDIERYWQNVQYNTGLGTDDNESLAQLLADTNALRGLKNGNTQYDGAMSNLKTLSTYATNLSGEDTFIAGYLSNFANARDGSFNQITQGTKGSDMVGYLEASNENLISQYVIIMNNLQTIYQIEYLALYLHANADKIADPDLSEWYASLEVYESNITKNSSLSDSLLNLNTDYYNKFGQLQKLILSALISDSPANGYPKDINGKGIAMTSAKNYKDAAPKGTWKDNFNLYVWQGLISSEYNATGYYDGITLTTPNIQFPKWQPKLDLSNCLWPETDEPNGYVWANDSGTTYFRTNCGTLKAANYNVDGGHYSVNYFSDQQTSHSDNVFYWSKWIEHNNDASIKFSDAFTTFYQINQNKPTYTYNGDEFVSNEQTDRWLGLTLDENNKFINPYVSGVGDQAIQVSLPDNTGALIQISLFNPSGAPHTFALSCGSSKGTGSTFQYLNDITATNLPVSVDLPYTKGDADNTTSLKATASYGDQHWSCEGPFISNQYGSRLDITTQTGKKYSIFAGMHGKNISHNDTENLYMDVCEYGDSSCAGKLGYSNPFGWSKAEDAYK